MKPIRYKQYLLIVLLVTLAFNYVDRLAFGLLLQDIKTDLSLSDVQLGLVTGIAFAFFYSVMGIPIARWADRGNRTTIIAVTTALWSVAVFFCGFVTNFWQLLLIRIGVAVGEAGCMPPAQSLIGNYYSREERPRAMSRYMLGAPLSVLIAFLLAGWLNDRYGWRLTFMLLGLPGIVLALIVWLTLKEPRQPGSTPSTQAIEETTILPQTSWADVCKTLWTNVTFRRLLLAYSIAAFFNAGIQQWKPTFFIRSFGLSTGEVGLWYAIVAGVGGLAGTYLGGLLASRYAANNERLQFIAMAVAYTGFGILSSCIYLSSSYQLAFVFMGLSIIGGATTIGPLHAAIQTLTPARMRATAVAVTNLFVNLIGLGFGPLAAGALSDMFRPWAGEESLRYSLLALCPGYLCVSWFLWRASRSVALDLREPDRRTA